MECYKAVGEVLQYSFAHKTEHEKSRHHSPPVKMTTFFSSLIPPKFTSQGFVSTMDASSNKLLCVDAQSFVCHAKRRWQKIYHRIEKISEYPITVIKASR